MLSLITQSEALVASGSVGRYDSFVATVNQYRFAPLTGSQPKLGVVDTSVSPLDGEFSVGAGNRGVSSKQLNRGRIIKMKIIPIRINLAGFIADYYNTCIPPRLGNGLPVGTI